MLQTGVNLGVLLACARRSFLLAGHLTAIRLPRRRAAGVARVLDPPARARAGGVAAPRRRQARGQSGSSASRASLDLFRGAVRRTTLLTIVVCASRSPAWWAFMFWYAPAPAQPARASPTWPRPSARPARQRDVLRSSSACRSSATSSPPASPELLGYRSAIALMCLASSLAMFGDVLRAARRTTTLYLWLAGGRVLLRRVRAVHDVPAAAVPDAAADDRGRVLLQHRPHRRGGGHGVLRLVRQGGDYRPRCSTRRSCSSPPWPSHCFCPSFATQARPSRPTRKSTVERTRRRSTTS